MIDLAVQALFLPCYFLALYIPRFAMEFRPGRRYVVGFYLYLFVIALAKTVLDFRWQVYGTGVEAAYGNSMIMAFTLPAAYLLCFDGDRNWRTGMILPYVSMQNLLIYPLFIHMMELKAPLTWARVWHVTGCFYLGMAYTVPLTLLALRWLRPRFESLPLRTRTVIGVLSPLGYILMNLQQLATLLYYGHRNREVWFLGCFGVPYATTVIALLCWFARRQTERELGYAEAREQMHHNALTAQQDNLTALRRLRADQQRHLRRVRALLEEGHPDRALEAVRALTRDCGSAGRRYADNPVADVALADAARRCARHGIQLQIDGNLPRQCTLPPVELASLLYNLLSNAVTAAAGAPGAGTVEVHFRTMAGRLCVTVRNPVGSDTPPRGPDHGFGMRILREITARHDGSYTLEIRDGRATAVAMVSLPEGGDGGV